MQRPYSNKKEDSEHLKIKWIYSRKGEGVIIENVSIYYSKKRVSVLTQQYYNGVYTEEKVYDLTTKTRKGKNQ